VSKRLCLVLTVLVAVTAFAAGAGSASAAPKEVAFVCELDICLLDPANPGNVFNLTDNGATSYDEDPTWSPDGKRLAFVANFSTTFPQVENIYTMEPEASDQTFNLATQITHFTDHVSTGEIAWSPDGSKLAFVRGNSQERLYVVNADGSSANATEIPTAGGVANPTFSADSGKIAFSHGSQVYTVNSDNSSPASALPGAIGEEPAWSPDGSRIAYGREFNDLEIISSAGGSPLATVPAYSQFAFLSWSPSGGQLAYHDATANVTTFRVVNADGSGDHGLPTLPELSITGGPASWSPDGTHLVFEGAMLEDPMTSADDVHKVYLVNADGSGSATPVSPPELYGTEPAWRPNPIAHPGPPVITPSGGSNGQLPSPTIKPTLKWFTNRIFWTYAPYVPMLSVACGGPVCNAAGTGTAKASVAAGIRPRPALGATASAKPKTSKKPKTIVVASGKVHVPSNQTRTLKLKLTKVAIAILKKTGKLKMSVTVTTTIAGQAPSKETRSVELFVKPKKKHKGA
jgi:Tol biopolymer transport system component